MFVLFEEGSQFKAALIREEAPTTLQIESDSGKRSKIKRSNCILTFASPQPQELLDQAQSMASEVDPEFLWEVAPEDEFEIQTLAAEYYGHEPVATEVTALLFGVHNAPVYFHRRGKGRYRRAPEEILKAALAAQEKKRLQLEQQQAWAQQLLQGELPAEVAEQALLLVTRPDKNGQVWKAVSLACEESGKTPDRLLLDCGAWPHELALHRARFMAANFPKGTGFGSVQSEFVHDDLPLADVTAYSVDDISTTEIDDALSVREIDDGWLEVGIHVAVPALGVTRDSELDRIARDRMSTVYMPGEKIPMQPDGVIDSYSLFAGKPVPALSLYVQAHPESGEVRQYQTRLERVILTNNLRHNELDAVITTETIENNDSDLPYESWLRPLWKLSKALSAVRDQRRGKPQRNDRVDYSFYVDGPADDPDSPVRIEPRKRNAPLDLLVAEYMILANEIWGKSLADHNLPGVYRSQQTGRVRMSTHALAHEAIGVAQYAWCTSPLRRYVDLVNQRQLVAMAQHGVSAPLVAPYKPKDADLFALISAFEAQYAVWSEFQQQMERYWCIRWMRQNKHFAFKGQVIRDDLVRLEGLPLVLNVSAMPELARATPVEIEVTGCDELTLLIQAQFVRAETTEAVS
ncbi:ribonuclease catalytic domain-containing protein [Orrella marina]|uniref:Ribonuclease II n=1 Tax=Orrella marina TaxID=2163011 RepID=A0A2R4XMY0_9BURK|nr:ribonuclease catalytic domain-containing protein [Orrella marina]AWB35157.1 ribonuclease II [Orrella marina]